MPPALTLCRKGEQTVNTAEQPAAISIALKSCGSRATGLAPQLLV